MVVDVVKVVVEEGDADGGLEVVVEERKVDGAKTNQQQGGESQSQGRGPGAVRWSALPLSCPPRGARRWDESARR